MTSGWPHPVVLPGGGCDPPMSDGRIRSCCRPKTPNAKTLFFTWETAVSDTAVAHMKTTGLGVGRFRSTAGSDTAVAYV